MFGVSRGVTLALVGWLWADLLLGLFAIFLAANSVGAAMPQARNGIDPKPVEITVSVDGRALLSGDADEVGREQTRIVEEVDDKLAVEGNGRRVALVLAFGTHDSPTEGDRLARVATEFLHSGLFEGAVIKTYHELRSGDPGSRIALEVFLYY